MRKQAVNKGGNTEHYLPDDQAGINIRNYIIMLNIKDALAAHAECDRKVILTEMFFFAYFRDIVCYHIAPSIL